MTDPEINPDPGEFSGAMRTEVLPGGRERVATGEIAQTIAHSAGNFIDMLEDGDFSADVLAELQNVARAMSQITNNTGAKSKGQVVLTIDLAKEGDALTIQTKVKAKMPELPRPKSIMWQDDAGAFSRFPPQQTGMFNPRRRNFKTA